MRIQTQRHKKFRLRLSEFVTLMYRKTTILLHELRKFFTSSTLVSSSLPSPINYRTSGMYRLETLDYLHKKKIQKGLNERNAVATIEYPIGIRGVTETATFGNEKKEKHKDNENSSCTTEGSLSNEHQRSVVIGTQNRTD